MVKDIVATSNLKLALENSEIIMICIPAHAHQDIASMMAPHLKAHHKIVINPGRTLGAFMFDSYLKEAGCSLDLPIGETDTFVLTSRRVRPGISQIFSRKRKLKVAALTKAHSSIIHAALVESFGMVVASDSILETSLSNLGMIFHPVPALFNIGRIELQDHYLHYKEGITPMIAKFLEKLDLERIALAHHFGLNLPNAQQWLNQVYGSEGANLYQTLQATTQYDEIVAPDDITTRYIYEDIPTGIVPILQLAKLAQTPHTTLQLVLDVANTLYGIDFNAIGRNDVQAFYELYRPRA